MPLPLGKRRYTPKYSVQNPTKHPRRLPLPSYMTYAPIVFVSAKTGQRLDKIFSLVNDAYRESCKRITTGVLNDFLSDITDRVQPPTDKGRRLKIYYMTQTATNPPTFALFCNSAELFHYSYLRYLENRLRDVYGFHGTPIKMIVRQRGEKE
ncbi:MAG: hypothetical protein IIW34_04045 [Clostridia bacterium]|nr:hypothetical protein [Clostridia bacterium]